MFWPSEKLCTTLLKFSQVLDSVMDGYSVADGKFARGKNSMRRQQRASKSVERVQRVDKKRAGKKGREERVEDEGRMRERESCLHHVLFVVRSNLNFPARF